MSIFLRFLLIFTIITSAMIHAGCKSSESQTANTPRDINYTQYETFSFGNPVIFSSDNPVFAWPQFTERVKREIAFVLPGKGLDRVRNRADLEIYFYAVIEPGKNYPILPYNIGWAAEPFITGGEVMDRYPGNTFFIDFVDTNNNQLVWRGSTRLPFQDEDELYKVLPKRIHSLLQPYPQVPSQ